MNKNRHIAKISAHMSYFIILISALLGYFIIVLSLSSCSKEDNIKPVATDEPSTVSYALFDYQDTLHIDYAMRTDLYDYNNIVFQFHEGGRLDLYSHHHLNLEDLSDTVKLVSYQDFSSNQQGVVATVSTDLFPYGVYIPYGKVILHRTGDLYVIDILGATESGLGFRSLFSGRVHDLTGPSNQGSLSINENAFTFHLGIMEQEGSLRSYHLIGSNPYAECVITSTVDIAGKDMPISADPEIIESGSAVGLTISIPYGTHITATSGTLQCSCYDDIHTLLISASTPQGPASAHFTGPIYTAFN